MDARANILGRIGEVSSPSELPDFPVWEDDLSDLIAKFEERFLFHSGKIASESDLKAWTNLPYCADPDARAYTPSSEEPVADVWLAEVGFSCADVLVAETGSILIRAEKMRSRLHSLVPPIHVVFARRNQVVAQLESAFDQLGSGNAALITGPSRTADIEGVLVHGAHGPKELWLVWID